ncbi:hypothetical protein [Endozoicomonas sp. 4G]|uniref:hypothetical protein n=1 Tax=Endozoicomonas sp. 4G TaxID=2872754 RepID=UPI0020787D39|nr:hypothetical protein [Endozoicomonas sp. 4G]
MGQYSEEKQRVPELFTAIESATPDTVKTVLRSYASGSYEWFGVYPFSKAFLVTPVAVFKSFSVARIFLLLGGAKQRVDVLERSRQIANPAFVE